jgi:hemolysin activation/secretion protein
MQLTSKDVMSHLTVLLLPFILLFSGTVMADGAGSTKSIKQAEQLRKATVVDELMQPRKEAEEKQRLEAAEERERQAQEKQVRGEAAVADIRLPEDDTPKLLVRKIIIAGNDLLSSGKLLKDLPLIYNASGMPLKKAPATSLYDLRDIREIIKTPDVPKNISMRSIQGLTQYLLSVYQKHNYAGIYVYVPEKTVRGTRLLDDVLLIQVLEAKISEVNINTFDTDQQPSEKSVLKKSIIEEWSPIEVGKVANGKELEDFLNTLNLNPDRYISATVSKGSDPKSLKLDYDIYEADPWHLYTQLDNSGSDERQWSPRVGFIHTNLTGRDDRLSGTYQAPVESLNENYSMFGSYDFPVFSPRFRLNVFGGYSQFDVSSTISTFDFIGNGSFYGCMARYNLYQDKGWFFDVTASLSHERSERVDVSVFNDLNSNVSMDLWSVGLDIHHRDDVSTTGLNLNRLSSYDGSDDSKFDAARPGADSTFNIYSVTAGHSRYLDDCKIQRISASGRWIDPDDRLVPSKMTAFGGLYSVRGYEEYELVADGGLLYSVQYEYDLVKYCESKEDMTEPQGKSDWQFTRLAPLAFFDFARAKTEDPVPGEQSVEEFASVGLGLSATFANDLDANLYYGFPLKSTPKTDSGDGRVGVNVLMRW